MGASPSFGVSLAPIKSLEEINEATWDDMEFAPVDVNVPKSPSWLQQAKDRGAALVKSAPAQKPAAKKSTPTWHWLVLAGVLGYGAYWLSKNYSV